MTANTTQHTGLFKTRYDPRGVDRARRSFNSLKTTGAGLARSLGGVYLAYLAIGKVAETVSKLQNAENLLRTATGSATEFARVQNELLEISHNTRVSYFGLAEGFKRYSQAAVGCRAEHRADIKIHRESGKGDGVIRPDGSGDDGGADSVRAGSWQGHAER